MKSKWAIWLVGLLVITNLLTAWLYINQASGQSGNVPVTGEKQNSGESKTIETIQEDVAKVGKQTITKQEWLDELVAIYGQQTLKNMIDREVVFGYAKEQNINVSDKEVEKELSLLRATYNQDESELTGTEADFFKDEDRLREEIRYSLLLEEILTKDIVISEDELKAYYEQNEDLYHTPTGFVLSHILVKTEEEADQVFKELKEGSSFSVLAMERSLDNFSANQGGKLGFVAEDNPIVPMAYIEAAKKLGKGEWSNPVKTDEGYAIVQLDDIVAGKSYSFEEVKGQIRRQLAIEQLDGAYSAEPLWSEIGVEWIFGEK